MLSLAGHDGGRWGYQSLPRYISSLTLPDEMRLRDQFPSNVVEVSFLESESRKNVALNCSTGGDWFTCTTGLRFWVFIGLNMAVVAFVSHFFPLLQLMLAKDDPSYLLSSTYIKHREIQSFFCSLAQSQWFDQQVVTGLLEFIHLFMHSFVHSLTYTHSISIHGAFT